jgi:hypothetical protein
MRAMACLPGRDLRGLGTAVEWRTDRQADRKPDVRGFALKVKGVSGNGALGSGTDRRPGFPADQPPGLCLCRADEFVGLAKHMVKGPGALFGYLVSDAMGFRCAGHDEAPGEDLQAPVYRLCHRDFHSAAPIACGPYAARVRLLAASSEPRSPAPAPIGRATSCIGWRRGPLRFELQLQFFVDEQRTPIEDASVDWPRGCGALCHGRAC